LAGTHQLILLHLQNNKIPIHGGLQLSSPISTNSTTLKQKNLFALCFDATVDLTCKPSNLDQDNYVSSFIINSYKTFIF